MCCYSAASTSVSHNIQQLLQQEEDVNEKGSDEHLPSSYKISHPFCFSSPPFFHCLALLSFERQAAHRPRRTHEAAAQHCHLPDMGQQKPAAWVRWQWPISHADTQPPSAQFIWAHVTLMLFREQHDRHLSQLSSCTPIFVLLGFQISPRMSEHSYCCRAQTRR